MPKRHGLASNTCHKQTTDVFSDVLQYVSVLEASILANLNVVSNVSIDSIKSGSVVVGTTIAFTGADGDAVNTCLKH